jgi:acyl-CoA thioester hydrolase
METIAAPFRALECHIRPEWLSAGTAHLFVANYVMLFNDAVRNLLTAAGMDDAYRESFNQIHVIGGLNVRYERELFEGDLARIDIIIADMDEKRVHLALETFRDGETARICAAEMLVFSFSRTTGRAAPWAGNISPRLAAMKAEHDSLLRPRGFGESLGIKRR